VLRSQVTGERYIPGYKVYLFTWTVPSPRNLQQIAKSHGSFESGLDTTRKRLPADGAEGEEIPVATSKVPEPAPLVPLRLALIVVISVLTGGVVGSLTYWAAQSLPQAILAGLAGTAGALLPLDKVIGR